MKKTFTVFGWGVLIMAASFILFLIFFLYAYPVPEKAVGDLDRTFYREQIKKHGKAAEIILVRWNGQEGFIRDGQFCRSK